MSKQEDIQCLIEFIEIEEKELQNEQPSGSWYAMNWHRLDGPIKKAHRLLPEETLRKLYYHALRRDISPGKQVAKQYPILLEAYRDQAIFLDKKQYSYHFSMMGPMEGLFLFGFNNEHLIQENQSFEDYITYRTCWLRLNSYSSIPGIIDKKEKLRVFAENPLIIARIEDTLRALRYYHSPEAEAADYIEERYNYTNLSFWGFISLLAQINSPVIHEFKAASYLPKFDAQMEILQRFL